MTLQINYCGPNTNCNNQPGTFECNEDDCKPGYTNWRANYGERDWRKLICELYEFMKRSWKILKMSKYETET